MLSSFFLTTTSSFFSYRSSARESSVAGNVAKPCAWRHPQTTTRSAGKRIRRHHGAKLDGEKFWA